MPTRHRPAALCLSSRTMETAVTVNVRPKSPIRNRHGQPIREGGVERMDRHHRWLASNGSLEVIEAAAKAEEKPAPKSKVKEEAKADG